MNNLARDLILAHPEIQERYDFTADELNKLSESNRMFKFIQVYIDPTRSLLAMQVVDSDGDTGWLKIGYGLGEEELEIYDSKF